MILAHHLILTGYGHWLPNDPRGSMSLKTYCPQLAQLAENHFGRKAHQPSLAELREFYRKANPLLAHPVLWFEPVHRQALAEATGQVVAREGLTCYAAAILSNHVHLLVRKHRVRAENMLERFKQDGRDRLRRQKLAPPDHPVFSADVCCIHKDAPRAIRACVDYITGNFSKHGLPVEDYPFVTVYDGWPLRPARR